MPIVNYQPLVDSITKTKTVPISANPTGKCFGIDCNVTSVGTLYYNILVTFLFVASLAAVITFIYAGIVYLTAGGEAEKAEKAKKMITGSIIGIIVIIASYTMIKWTIGVVN
jgi:hypothetical protein